jgi:hypothetical protein
VPFVANALQFAEQLTPAAGAKAFDGTCPRISG